MNDEELTIAAGKAIGLTGTWQRDSLKIDVPDMPGFFRSWYPLHDNDAATGILAELGERGYDVSLRVAKGRAVILLNKKGIGVSEPFSAGGCGAAVRLAIVKAAAHIYREGIKADLITDMKKIRDAIRAYRERHPNIAKWWKND